MGTSRDSACLNHPVNCNVCQCVYSYTLFSLGIFNVTVTVWFVFHVYRLDAFDSDVKSLTDEYKALKPECQDEEILDSFQRRWTHARERLTNKLSRGRV